MNYEIRESVNSQTQIPFWKKAKKPHNFYFLNVDEVRKALNTSRENNWQKTYIFLKIDHNKNTEFSLYLEMVFLLTDKGTVKDREVETFVCVNSVYWDCSV